MTESNRRQVAWQIIGVALKAVDPNLAVKNFFKNNPQLATRIVTTTGRVIVVGAGKAGAPMAAAVSDIFGDKIATGRVVVKYGHSTQENEGLISNIEISEAGHPVPDQAGLEAARAIVQLLEDANEKDTVLCLVSGGGSALLALPADGLTLEDLQVTTQSLLAAGATINDINTIRKHLSAVKGGRLAQIAAPATVYTLILSDVVGDPLPVIASGPTVPDPTTFADAWVIVEQYQLQDTLPQTARQRLRAGRAGEIPDTPKPGDPIFERIHNAIIGSNRIAAQAAVDAARAAGFEALLLTTFIEGEAQGGRNQEMALAAAMALDGWSDILIVGLGTDGTDGPTNAAGAYVDGATIGRAQELGLDAVKFLNRNDAYNFFKALNDLIITGPTQTNVNDLTIIFAW